MICNWKIEIEIHIDLNSKFSDHQNRANYLYFDEILNGCSLVEDACNGIIPCLEYFFNGKSACIFTHGITGKKYYFIMIAFILFRKIIV